MPVPNKYQRETDVLLRNAPDYVSSLVASGYFHCNISDNDYDPPAIAWTMFNDEAVRWEIHFRPQVADLSPDAQRALWRHEVGHIAFAHFQKEMCNPEDPIRSQIEMLQVGDIQINTYLALDGEDKAMAEIGKAAKALAIAKGAEDDGGLGYLNPRTILPEIGLVFQPYPYEIIHAYLHQEMDENSRGVSGEGPTNWTEAMCGGIQGDAHEGSGSAMAEATAAVVAGVASEGGKDGIAESWGSEHGLGQIRLRDYHYPSWLNAVESFARSIVETELADKRSHTRPQEIYSSVGVHIPTMRPRWAYKPATACFLVDTSGSMMHELQYVVPVVQYLNQHEISVRLIAGDTQVTMDEEFKPGMPLPEAVVGGGGTEITPLFKRAEDYEPQSIVCFTDGWVPVYPKDTGVETLWVGIQDGASRPNFGTVV